MMKRIPKKSYLLIVALFLCISLISACTKESDGGEINTQNDISWNSISLQEYLEQTLGKDIEIPEEQLQKYYSKIEKMIKENNQKLLREEAASIQEDFEEGSLEQLIYQNLYHMVFYEVKTDVESQTDLDELFLEIESIQEQPIKTALIDIGLVSTQSEESLQQIRESVVRLIRGKDETEEEFIRFQDDLEGLVKTMNNIDASVYRAVFSVAQKEAINGSATFPFD